MLKNWPALSAALVQTVLAIVLSFGLFHWGPATVGVIEAAAAAAVALWVARNVRPFPVPVLTGFLNAGITLLVAFRVPHVTPALVSLVDAVVVTVAAFFVHGNVTAKVNLPRASQAAPAPAGAYEEKRRI